MAEETQPQATRERVLDAAFALLESGGPEALKARAVTGEVGASTMAIYTHFGGMPGLVDALVREGLLRFAAYVRERQPRTDDPVADLIAGGMAYGRFAIDNSQLYRLMFGLSGVTGLRGSRSEAEAAGEIWEQAEANEAFSVLLESVERVIEEGRFRRQDARAAATQFLGATHGLVLLLIGGLIGDAETAMGEVMAPLSINLMVGLGDERARVEASFARALELRVPAG